MSNSEKLWQEKGHASLVSSNLFLLFSFLIFTLVCFRLASFISCMHRYFSFFFNVPNFPSVIICICTHDETAFIDSIVSPKDALLFFTCFIVNDLFFSYVLLILFRKRFIRFLISRILCSFKTYPLRGKKETKRERLRSQREKAVFRCWNYFICEEFWERSKNSSVFEAERYIEIASRVVCVYIY